MNQYVDASVILRIVVHAADALPEGQLLYPTSSALLQIECLRTLERFTASRELKRAEIPRTYAALHEAMRRIELLKIDDTIIERAGGQFGRR